MELIGAAHRLDMFPDLNCKRNTQNSGTHMQRPAAAGGRSGPHHLSISVFSRLTWLPFWPRGSSDYKVAAVD